MIAYASINISYILDCSYDSVIAPSNTSFDYALGENQTFQTGNFTNMINLCNNSLSFLAYDINGVLSSNSSSQIYEMILTLS